MSTTPQTLPSLTRKQLECLQSYYRAGPYAGHLYELRVVDRLAALGLILREEPSVRNRKATITERGNSIIEHERKRPR